jgi:GDP-L-fucose synthase
MKLLITGGSGYIARNLKPLFERAGYDVLAPSRTELDLFNFESLVEYLKQNHPDAIIHAATKGGKRTKKDTFDEVYIPNIRMFENLYRAILQNYHDFPPTILIGSGAEFDRRYPIQLCREEYLFSRWPTDPYGLSKNIIARRALSDFENMWVLRIFGCFNYNEEDTRFIKRSILNLKKGLPIEIHRNMEMDFFYMDDIFIVMDYIFHNPTWQRNLNLVYDKKMDLLKIANLIHKHTKIHGPAIKEIEPFGYGSYTGDYKNLYELPIVDKLIGFDEGLCRTIEKVL